MEEAYWLAVISLSVGLNFSTLTYLVANKFFPAKRVAEGGEHELLPRQGRRFDPGKTIIDLVFSVLLPLSGFSLFLTTDISNDPFNSYSDSFDIAFSLLASYYITTIIVILFTDASIPKNAHLILHHVAGIVVVVGVVALRENPVLGLVGLFMSGDGLTHALVTITQTLPRFRHTMAYRIVLCLHIMFVVVFRVTFPVLLTVIPLTYSWQQLVAMQTASQVMYFVAMTVFLAYNAWLVWRICTKTIRDMKSISKTGVQDADDCETGEKTQPCLRHLERWKHRKIPQWDEIPSQEEQQQQQQHKHNKFAALQENRQIIHAAGRSHCKPGQIRIKRNPSLSREPLCDSDHMFFPAMVGSSSHDHSETHSYI